MTAVAILPTVKDKLAILLVILLLFATGFGFGYAAGRGHDQDKMTQVATDKGGAESDARAASATLSEIRHRLDAQGVELAAAQKAAADALSERDALRADLAKRSLQHETDLRNKAHEAPDCASLAQLPICPVVADGLWGKSSGDPTAGGSR
jgi:hypothetical protein